MKEKFIFFENFKEAADKLPDDLRLKFYDAMTNYVFNDVEPEDAVVKALIMAIKPQLDIEDKRGGARVGAGRKSKEIKVNQNNQNDCFEKKENQNNSIEIKINQSNSNNIKEKQEKKTPPLNPQKENNKNKNLNPFNSSPFDEKDNTIDIEEIIAEKSKKRPHRPTPEEVKDYCLSMNYPDVSENFVDFYTSKGWLVGKVPMKDWKAAVRGWVSRKKTLDAARFLLPQNGVRSASYGEDIPL